MTKSARNEAKTAHLIEKGMEVLWENGYNGTSVNDIVKAAEVPKGSFYFYFDSKEDFVLRSIQAYYDEFVAPAVAILHDTSQSPGERLYAFYRVRMEEFLNSDELHRGCLACNIGTEVAEHNAAVLERVSTMHEGVKAEILKVALEAQAAGEIRPGVDVPSMVSFFEDAGKGAMLSVRETKSTQPMENVWKVIQGIFFGKA